MQYDPLACLPSAAELPDSDDTPVDNELQNLIPNLLAATLALVWRERIDWFFGVDMGIYHAPSQPAIVPDGFLSIGVDRFVNEPDGRLSYVMWEERIAPQFALEVVSRTYNGEYEQKKTSYAELGVLYYAIYVPSRGYRRQKPPLEVYKLKNGEYQLQQGDLVWMPEIGLAIGRGLGTHQGWMREWLYWYDEQGQRLLTPEETVMQERERAVQERERADRLAAKLQELGIDPTQL